MNEKSFYAVENLKLSKNGKGLLESILSNGMDFSRLNVKTLLLWNE
jgi:hypothetical protein